ncbi:L30e-like protein [Hesseltinella vesiculosa]|uniref:H/ACA ribonucleoprotein complex subunit 2 n=1 Tax=Hesseltinella vesiculosa TaxID=101127 RepID=A0A1X2G374_9FUNG|nr:L30e-like protein [Hesseltinella vesiculosa]
MAKDKKDKKEKKVKTESSEKSTDKVYYVSPIAHPMADDKMSKKLFKTVKKASKAKHVCRGVKEVAKALSKGEKGLVVIAGDISPMDVIAHMPVLCEDHDVPYVFVPSKEQLGEACATKRPTSVSMVVLGGKKKDLKAADDYKELYDDCFAQAKKLVQSISHQLFHAITYLFY